MSDALPRGWAATTIGDVVAERVDQAVPERGAEITYIDISSIDNRQKRVATPSRINGASAPTRARQCVQSGDVLVSMTRPNLNAVAILPPQHAGSIASTGFDVLRTTAIEPRWLYFAVQTTGFIDAMCERIQGVVYPAVRPRDIRAFALPLPPLPEQRRIVETLDTHFTRLDAAVATLERVRANLKRYRAAVLHAAVDGSLLCDDDGKWPTAPLSSAADVLVGPPFPSATFQDQGIRLLRGDNVEPGRLRWRDARHWPANDVKPYERFLLAAGDVIVAMDRPVVTAGFKSAQVTAADTPSLLVQRVARIRSEDPLLRRWIFIAARSERFIRHVMAGQTGTQLPHIRSREILDFPLPMPNPATMHAVIERTEELVTVAEECDRVAAVSLRRAVALRRSLLRLAFDGRLVPQDSHDEPALILLDRIRAERAAASSSKTTKSARKRR